MKRLLSSVMFCILFSTQVFPQINLLREMLDLPAPPPVSKSTDENGEERQRPEEFYDKKNVPPDDAPIEDLIDFWKRQNFIDDSHSNKIKPTDKTLARLVELIRENPGNLSKFLYLLPINPENTAIVKNIYETQISNFDDTWREAIKMWLKFNSSYFFYELYAEANNARDHRIYKTVDKQEQLRALAKVDWEKAESLLEKLEADRNNSRTAFYAKRLIYEHAIKEKDSATIEKYRSEFQKIVENKSATGIERDDALEALIQNKEWQGQEDWYLSLFEDETLIKLTLGESTMTNPLDGIVYKNPDKWIPEIVKLVGNKNRTIHNSAVQALIQFQNRTARKDALEPLLPWLSNPEWADVDDRLRLVQSMGFIDMPESIPGLIWTVENADYDSKYAADALVRYKDARAVPALKIALTKADSEDDRPYFYRALIASNGFSVDEQLAAIETYAEKISTPEGYKEVEEKYFGYDEVLPLQISIGKYLAKQTEPNENLIVRLIEQQKILQKEKPEVAKILSGIMSKWQGRLIDLKMLDRIGDGRADIETIIGALVRRKELKERVANELYQMRGKSGLASGIAACLLEDESDLVSAFHSENLETRIATLACARLLRKSLPVREVGAMLDSPNKLLALAAERYLESEDSPEARQLVLSKHPNEAIILGARTSFNPAKQPEFPAMLGRLFASVDATYGNYLRPETADFAGLDKFEDKLRDEIKANLDLLEIYTIVPSYVVRVYKDKVVFTLLEDKARYYEGVLKKEQFEDLKRFLTESNLEETPPIFGNCHYNCGTFEYARFNRNGGRRFFAYTAFESFIGIRTKFQTLGASDSMKLHYYLQNKIKNLEVLSTDKKFLPRAVWKTGDDFRVLVSDEERKSQIEDEIAKLDKIDDANEDLDYEIRGKNARQRRIDRAFEHYEWLEFKNGKLGGAVDEPLELPFLRDKLSFPDVQNLSVNDSVWQSKSGNYEIRAGDYNEGGLWKTNRSGQIEFKKGVYHKPIVSGNWVVAAKADENWAAPNYVVRVNLQTGKELKINLPPAEEFYPIAFVPAHNKLMLYRAKEAYSTLNPTIAEYYLLDAKTGNTELVKGEFQPLITQTFRPLQPTDKPNEFWATVYSRAKNESDFGVYDAKKFTFQSVLKLPEILLNSMDVWVDANEAKVYFVYSGDYGGEAHLLSLTLPNEK